MSNAHNTMTNLVTFGFVGEEIKELRRDKSTRDDYKKLKQSAKIACNFWNGHINPSTNVVLQIGIFTDPTIRTVARAYLPFEENGVKYGKILFNTSFLRSKTFISTVMIHEICHSLGFGWEPLARLYDRETGIFHQEFIDQVPELALMKIELDYGPGTRYSHWDEDEFKKELMTGVLSSFGHEHVLPVTIKIMQLLGHEVVITPPERLNLNDRTINKLSKIKFRRKKDVDLIDTLYERETEEVESMELKSPWWQMILQRLLDWA